MVTREIKLPENYKKYFKTESEITDLVEDYIEREQDEKLKEDIENSTIILNIDKELKNILGVK
ncbi:MAG: hypothetical protein Q9M94_05200 [Candidatus Gracilibacteria bacterium]|nr:hypothetical protein [Candidatus Gracilibacteria bacterium]